MIVRVLIWAFILVTIYRVLAKYILPIFQITRMASGKLQQMQRKMEEMEKQMNRQASQPKVNHNNDYIDYEEIK